MPFAFIRDRRAAAGSQYALVLGLVCVVVIATIALLGGNLKTLQCRVASTMCNVTGAACSVCGTTAVVTVAAPPAPTDPTTPPIPSGSALSWGQNDYAELGTGACCTDSSSPVTTTNITANTSFISAGQYHSCFMQSGSLKCWGLNHRAQLGTGAASVPISSNTPITATAVSGSLSYMTAGGNQSCYLSSGTLYCFGADDVGQLGNGSTPVFVATPVTPTGMTSGVTFVATEAQNTCAIQTGTLYCWGNNTYGTVGMGATTPTTISTPTAVVGITGTPLDADVGNFHICTSVPAGVQCWGYGGGSELGNGSTSTFSTAQNVIGISSQPVTITVGGGHSCALLTSGVIRCWGQNANGQLGNGNTTNQSSSVAVVGLSGTPTAIGAGALFTCAITSTGVQCWGRNDQGQLGNGTCCTQSLSPVTVTGLPGIPQRILVRQSTVMALFP